MFDRAAGFSDRAVTVPCGQCIGCRLERSRQWAMRCVHENQLHTESMFITLTYSDDHLPFDGGLRKEHFQKFMKRLRARYENRTIRYFHCGEYGSQGGRPHYHALIFGLDFVDKIFVQERRGHRIYISPTLSELWPFGLHEIGTVTFESAAYVARYIVDKVTGEAAADHYQSVDLNGEIHSISPEYVTMSRRPGIGADWYEKYHSDVFPSDEVVIRGKTMKPPAYYDKLLEKQCVATYNRIKSRRTKEANKPKAQANTTRERLDVREKVKKAQVKSLKRTIT